MAPTKAFKSSRERKAFMQAAAESSLKQKVPSSNPPGKAPSPGDSQQQPVLPGRPISGKLNTPNKKPSGGTAPAAGAAGRSMLPAQPGLPAHANGAAGNGKAHDVYDFAESDSDVEKDLTLSNGQPSAAAKAAAGAEAARTKKAAAPVRRRKVQPINRVKLVYDEHMRFQEKRVQDAAGHSGDENDPMQHQQAPCVSLLDDDSDHSPTARRSNDSRKGLFAAAPHGAAGMQARPQQQQQQLQHYGGSRQADIRQFARKTSAQNQSASEALPAGMLNHGNTCYLNAILQALLSLPCLARELHPACSSRSQASSNISSTGLSQLQLPPDGITTAMQECLRQHQEACQRGGGLSGLSPAAISPVEVRNAMQKRASHWGAARQEDAHEFFTALLHGLSDEVQQAQLELMKASKGAGHKQSIATGGAAGDAPHSDAPSSAAAQAPSSTADLPPSADDAAQACQAEPHRVSTAAAGGACPAAEHGMQQQQQEQPQGDKDGTPPPDAAPGAAVGSAPADAGEPRAAGTAAPAAAAAAAGKAADGGSARSSRQPTPACQLPSMPVSQTLCPVSRNFLGCLQHTFTCSVCGHRTCVKEQFNHLILDLPADDDSAGGSWPSLAPVADLSSLLANFFAPETCDKACEGCGAAEVQHRLEHAIRRLPRVLVVQLKRFKWLWSASGIPDCRKVPTPVKPDKQLFLGRLCVPGRPVPPLLAELMPQPLLQSAIEAAGEQPLERQPHHQQQEQQRSEQPAQQQLFGSIASMGNGSTAPPAAAAVADGALGRLQNGAADAPTAGVVQAQDQQQNRQQAQQQLDRRPGVKRLGSSGNWVLDTHSGLQPAAPKKPKVVAGQQFGSNSSSVPYKGSLTNFWHPKQDLGNSKRLQSLPRPSPLDPSKFSDDWKVQTISFDDLDAPPPLRRNNSSSAAQPVDLIDLADAAVDDEFERELQAAIALSLQEPQQQAGGPAKQPDHQQQQQSPASSTHGSDGPLPDYDSLPDWMDEQHTAAAAAPPGSPMDSSPSPPEDIFGLLGRRVDKPVRPNGRAFTTGQDCGAAAVDHPATATSPGLNAPGSPTLAAAQHGEGQLRPAVADDSTLGLTPPQDGAAAAGQHGRTGLLTAMQCDRGPSSPKSPAPTAPRPDRSGFVSSSAAPGGRWRPSDAATAAAAAAALRCSNRNALLFKSLSGNATDRDQTLLQEVQAAGMSEDEQLARAIAESMKEQGSAPAAAAAAAGEPPAAAAAAAGGSGATAHAADAAAAAPGAAGGIKDVEMEDVVVGSDVVEDEDAVMKRVLAESAAEHERHQQQKLLDLQQQEEAAAAARAAAAGEADAAAAAAAGPAGAAAAGAGSSKERQEEKPPALLLRLLEDSDYEAEQEELQGSSKQQGRRSSSPTASGDTAGRSASPTADSTAAAAGAADKAEGVKAGSLGPSQQPSAGGDEGSRPASRRRVRGQKQRQQRGASKAADNHKGSAAAAAAADCAAGDIKAEDGDAGTAAEGVDFTASMVQDSGLDKENQAEEAAAAEAAAAEAAAEADTDAVADGSVAKRTKAAAAKASGSRGRAKPTQQQRKVLGEIFGAGSSSLNAAAGRLTSHAAAAAALDPPHKPPAVAAAVAASRAAAAAGAAAGSSHAPAAAARAAAGAEGEVQELQEGVAAGAVGSWPQEAAAAYSLTAVVRHMGDLVSVGHFTSDVLNSETKRWYHYDDSRVELLAGIKTVGRICQRDGYLFFYVNDAISDK